VKIKNEKSIWKICCTQSIATELEIIVQINRELSEFLFRFWEIEVYNERHWKYNITVYCVNSTELRRNEYYVTLYIHWMYFFVYYMFPFIALVIFNTAIYRRVSNMSPTSS